MDKLVRKIEVPLAKNIVQKAGLYLVPKERLGELAEVAADAYQDYPLHNWFMGGKYDEIASKLLMQISLKTMTEDAVIYADSEEINGFAAWVPFGFTGNKAIPFLLSGGLKLILHSGLGIINRLSAYENYAMGLKKEYTDNYDWYLFNLPSRRMHRERASQVSLCARCWSFATMKIWCAIWKPTRKAMSRCISTMVFNWRSRSLYPKAMLCITP